MEEAVEAKPTAENTENTRVFPVDFERRESQLWLEERGGSQHIATPKKINNDS